MLFVVPVLAQTSGSISGEVKDEKQAVVTNATVTVRNVKTNETRTTSTDGDGRYRFHRHAGRRLRSFCRIHWVRQICSVGNQPRVESGRHSRCAR